MGPLMDSHALLYTYIVLITTEVKLYSSYFMKLQGILVYQIGLEVTRVVRM